MIHRYSQWRCRPIHNGRHIYVDLICTWQTDYADMIYIFEVSGFEYGYILH